MLFKALPLPAVICCPLADDGLAFFEHRIRPIFTKRGDGCGSAKCRSSARTHLAKQVDDMAFLMAMQSKSNVHGPVSYLQTSGSWAGGN